ncbi:MAG TPA: trigger factor [Catalimonadaceae bacterium]|nr:trigger factor [Catalimonadaceae bacterium]
MGFFVSSNNLNDVEITFDKKENASALLTVELAQADYQPDYRAKIKDYSKKVSMKGFRPGKVPVELVERMYGQALRSEAISQVLNQSIDRYLKDNNIDVLGDLITDETNPNLDPAEASNQTLKFSFLMAMRPEIKYPPLDSLKIEMPDIQVSEEKVNAYIEDLRQRFGTMKDAEIISEGDFIRGSLKANDGSFETDAAIPFSRIKEGYQNQFIGKKVGDSIEFPIEEAFEENDIKYVTNTFKEKDRSFSGLFTLTLTQIESRIPAELNEEFFEKAAGPGKATNEEEFKVHIRALFSETYEKETLDYFSIKLENELFSNSNLVLAEDVINKVIKNRAQGKMSAEEAEDFIPRYIRSMKMSLIRGQVAADNNIQLSEQDIIEAAKKQIASDFQQMGYGNLDDEFLEKYAGGYLEEKGKDNRERMAEKALTAKITQLALQKSNIVRKAVTIEEYNKLVEELN